MKIKKNGFSLIELMLTLAIVAAMSVVAFYTYAKISDDLTAKKMLNTVKLTYSASSDLSSKMGASATEEDFNAYNKLVNKELYNEDGYMYPYDFNELSINSINGKTILMLQGGEDMKPSVCIKFYTGVQDFTRMPVDFGMTHKDFQSIAEISDYCNSEHNGYSIIPILNLGSEDDYNEDD